MDQPPKNSGSHRLISGTKVMQIKTGIRAAKKGRVSFTSPLSNRQDMPSILDDLKVPIGVIQRILGHQNRQTTEIYLHSVGEAERDAMKKLEDLTLFQSHGQPTSTAPTNMPVTFWNRKVERPTYDVLKKEIGQMGYSATGRKYGVSDNAVRKWVRAYEKDLGAA